MSLRLLTTTNTTTTKRCCSTTTCADMTGIQSVYMCVWAVEQCDCHSFECNGFRHCEVVALAITASCARKTSPLEVAQ